MRRLLFAVLIVLALEACTSVPPTLSPGLETEIRAWVRTRFAPGGVRTPCAAPVPEAAPALWEVG